MAIDDKALTVKEVSELLQIHETTVYKMIREGKIPAFKIGSDWRFLKHRIERWLAEQNKGAPGAKIVTIPRRR
jgi:excisionase family DNA binding protein